MGSRSADGVEVRRMRAEDVGAALALLALWNMAPRPPTPQVPEPERSGLDVARSFVAVDAGRVVGTASFILHGDALGETASLAVLPAYRGLGIGYRLQCARLSEMKHQGVRRVRTEADRPETIAWYRRRFGYRVVAISPKKHDFGLAEVDHWTVLELDLEAWRD